MRIADISTRNVACIEGRQSIREAARLMRARHVGALVVIEQPDGDRIPIGMLTDRDIVVAVVAAAVDPDTLTVADVMSRDVLTCDDDAELIDAIESMRARGVRRMPVVNRNGSLVGVVAVDDVQGALAEQSRSLAQMFTSEKAREMRNRP